MKTLNKILLISIVILSSCSKRIIPSTKTETETKIEYIQKDTTIYIAGDTVRVKIAIPCPGVELHKEVFSKGGKTKATVDVRDNELNVTCETDSLQARIKWLEARRSTVKTITNTNMIIKKEVPKWCWYLLVIVAVYVGARILIYRFKVPVKL